MSDRLINILVMITLVEMTVAIGLGVALADLRVVITDWRLLTRAMLVNYVCVPAITVALVLWFQPPPMVAAGFMILAVCPGAPYIPPFAAIAKCNMAAAAGLMVVLAGSSAIIAPLLLGNLMRLVSRDEPQNVGAAAIMSTLLATQLAPLTLGVAVRQISPPWAKWLQEPANLISKILNLVTVSFILITRWSLLADIQLRGLVGMLILLLASWAAGWFMGGGDLGTRRMITLTASMRNIGVGLVIAAGAFAGTAAITATLAYGLFAVAGSLLLALAWARGNLRTA